jgi:hypothetical protein
VEAVRGCLAVGIVNIRPVSLGHLAVQVGDAVPHTSSTTDSAVLKSRVSIGEDQPQPIVETRVSRGQRINGPDLIRVSDVRITGSRRTDPRVVDNMYLLMHTRHDYDQRQYVFNIVVISSDILLICS